ncbi:Scramblase [Metschnikowia aff. pulcherrima]|uniref:Phospholipid scramblase n=1 Tax=Metschnikowia aff. pulcherrima TaxID=2163413 RepID=A0A4P6XI69_9ASCO|nr:Scramblase [Metschnikowia aff. pulcherrima]
MSRGHRLRHLSLYTSELPYEQFNMRQIARLRLDLSFSRQLLSRNGSFLSPMLSTMLGHCYRSHYKSAHVSSTTRALSHSTKTLRTRRTEEISPEEIKRLRELRAHRTLSSYYYHESPSSDAREYQNDPSQYRTVFEMPPNENGIITPEDGIYSLLKEPTLVIERQVEFMNVILGFEQANKYKIMNSLGEQIGYMEEKDYGILKMIGRQFFRLHRPFDIDVFNNYGDLLMTIKRPFSFINSHIKCLLPGFDNQGNLMHEVIGESVQSWHLWRRRYNLFKLDDETTDEYNQFGLIDLPFLAFDFPVKNEAGDVIASVDRNWVGLGRELFTDSGVYIIRMDPASFAGLGDMYPSVAGPLTLDQRAILLGNAVSIDFDYFSRHSRQGGGFLSFGSYE